MLTCSFALLQDAKLLLIILFPFFCASFNSGHGISNI